MCVLGECVSALWDPHSLRVVVLVFMVLDPNSSMVRPAFSWHRWKLGLICKGEKERNCFLVVLAWLA